MSGDDGQPLNNENYDHNDDNDNDDDDNDNEDGYWTGHPLLSL